MTMKWSHIILLVLTNFVENNVSLCLPHLVEESISIVLDAFPAVSMCLMCIFMFSRVSLIYRLSLVHRL